MKLYWDSTGSWFKVDKETHAELGRWQMDEFELGRRVATAIKGGYTIIVDAGLPIGYAVAEIRQGE